MILFTLIWIFSGLVGHEPWKPDEGYTFGLVYHMMQTGDWIVPILADEPFIEKPPLFFIVAAWFGHTFSRWVSLPDAARFSTAFFMAVTCLFTWLTARKINSPRHGNIAVLILLGSLGLIVRAHQLITDIALLSGFAISYYAFAISPERPRIGGLLLGTGVGLGFMSKGLIAPGSLGLIALVLPLVGKNWRNRHYALALLIAFLAALPWLIVWPLLLYQRNPQLFHDWFFVQNWGRFFGTAHLAYNNEPFFYFYLLPWYGWPAWPIALWTLWHEGRVGFSRPGILLPLVCFWVFIIVLTSAGEARELYALPLLPSLALLASARIDFPPGLVTKILNRAIMTIFILLTFCLWLAYGSILIGKPTWIGQLVSKYTLPGYTLPFQVGTCILALLISGLYLRNLTLSRTHKDNVIIQWTAGITIVWSLTMTLWLPLINEVKSYRGVIASLADHLPKNKECVASQGLGEPQRALLYYYAGLITERQEKGRGQNCRYLLQQEFADAFRDPSPNWVKVWEGGRPGDSAERFHLFRRYCQVN